jgi:hypothetical protein
MRQESTIEFMIWSIRYSTNSSLGQAGVVEVSVADTHPACFVLFHHWVCQPLGVFGFSNESGGE